MADPMAKVLVAATAKGGAGKSTTIACLAVYWHKAGRQVALLDADPNRTLTRWHGKGNVLSEMTLRTELDEHAIISTIGELARASDLVLVDCAGFGNQAMIFAIGAADLVLIPAMTDEANVFEAARTFRIVESASQLTRRTIPAHTFLCRVKRSAVATHARAQLARAQDKPANRPAQRPRAVPGGDLSRCLADRPCPVEHGGGGGRAPGEGGRVAVAGPAIRPGSETCSPG